MKFLKKVSTIEVKRCFCFSQFVRWQRRSKGHLKLISKEEFQSRLASANKRIKLLSRKELDKTIAKEWKKRLVAYDASRWYLAEVKPSELGVWKRAGELPLSWTNRTLVETASHVDRAIKGKFKHKRIRAAHAIPGILKTSVGLLQSEEYLFPIVFKGGTGTNGRAGLKHKTKGDIDDGCMRSIALTISGAKTLLVYFGVPKYKSRSVAT